MMNYKILKNIGLSEREAKIYASLLINGAKNISEISKDTGINRPAIYSIIPNLIELGIINKIIKKRSHYYEAGNPVTLEKLYSSQQKKVSKMLTYLKETHKKDSFDSKIKVFEGEKGINQVMNDVAESLNSNDTFYKYSSRKPFNIETDFPKNSYRKKRDKKRLQRYSITSEELFKTKKKNINKETAVIPKAYDEIDDNITKIIYKNKVAYINYNNNNSLIIEDLNIADFERKIFKQIFSYLKSKQ